MWIKTQLGKLMNFESVIAIDANDMTNIISDEDKKTPFWVKARTRTGGEFVLGKFVTLGDASNYLDRLADKIGAKIV